MLIGSTTKMSYFLFKQVLLCYWCIVDGSFQNHTRSSFTMPCWVILYWKIFVCQYFWKPSGPFKLNFFLSKKTTFCHSLALMVWYWWSYSSCFSLCFTVNLRWWILFLCLIFLLFKCLLIVPVLQGASTWDFNIFDVGKVCFLLLFYLVNIFLTCQLVFLCNTYLDRSNNCR